MEKLLANDKDLLILYNQDISAKSAISLFHNIIKNKPEESVIKDLIITSNILREKEPNNIVLKNSIDYFFTNLHPKNIKEIAAHKYNKILNHLNFASQEISKNLFKKLKNNTKIFVHSINNLIYDSLLKVSKEKKIEINLVRQKPFGEIFYENIIKKGIKGNLYDDLDIKKAIQNSELSLIGCEGIIKNKSAAKKGSEIAAYYSKKNNIPLYVLTHSLKHTKNEQKIEQYDILEPESITAYICEYGVLKPEHIQKEILFHNSKLFF